MNQFAVTDTLGLLIARLFPLELFVFGVATLVEDHLRIAFEREDVRTDTIQEPTVVRNDHCTTGKVLQTLFQCPQRIDVDIVGRLVKQQHVGTCFQGEG